MTETPADPNTNESLYVRVDASFADGSVTHGSGVWYISGGDVLTSADLVWRNGVAATSVVVEPLLAANPTAILPVDSWHYFQVGALDATNTQADFALLRVDPAASSGSHGHGYSPSYFGGDISRNQVGVVGFPASAGGSTAMTQTLTIALDPNTWTFHYSGATLDPGYSGSGLIFSANPSGPANLGSMDAGIVTSAGTLGVVSPVVSRIIQSWWTADIAATPPAPGGIAVAVPVLMHPIAGDTNAVGVNPAEAVLVDSFSYANKNPDVVAAGMDPAVHFALYGWHENRAPDPLFDVNYYLAHNPDVAASGMDPLLHYAMYGWKEGRDPSASFSTKTYLADNADVKAAGIDPLQHYLYYGVNEFRAGGQIV